MVVLRIVGDQPKHSGRPRGDSLFIAPQVVRECSASYLSTRYYFQVVLLRVVAGMVFEIFVSSPTGVAVL